MYDVVVVGAGPGGYVAAIRAAQRGASVAVIERSELGGVCLNVGCIPTKTLIYSAELYHRMQDAASFGLAADNVRHDMKALVERKNKVIALNTGGIAGLFKAHNIAHISGEARIIGPGQIRMGDDIIQGRNILIATGGRPARLPGLETNGRNIIGSTEALELTALPERIAVIGAGPIGAEFACIWNNLGAQVSLIEILPRVLPNDDSEISKRMGAVFKKSGIDVRTATKVAKMEDRGETVHLTLEGEKAGELEVDLVLVAIGFECNSEVVEVSASFGVELGPRGAIVVNNRMETSVKGIYAIGDVINKTWLAHGASAEGIVAATNMTGGDKRMDYRVVPRCTFTSPEVAAVGLTEDQAKAEGYEVKTGKFLFSALGRAHAMGATEGMVKLVADAKTDELLGVHIMGHEAGELIAAAALAIKLEATVEELAETIHTHPTLSEAMMEAAEDYYGMGIHTRPKAKR